MRFTGPANSVCFHQTVQMELNRHGSSYRNHVISVLCGIIIGTILTFLTSQETCVDESLSTTPSAEYTESNLSIKSKAVERLIENESQLKEIKELLFKLKNNTHIYHKKEEDGQIIDTTVADKLRNEVRILCWVLTVPDYHLEKAIHVKNTWSSRCNDFLIMSTKRDSGIGTIALNVTESGDHVWGKMKEAFKYIHRYHLNNIDWVLKVEDDTYVVVENLRYMLYQYSPDNLVHFGYKRQSPLIKQGYMDHGAYVMSRAAVEKMVKEGFDDDKKCRSGEIGDEEFELAKCLENLDIYAGDSRDKKGKERFFIRAPESHLMPEFEWDSDRYYPSKDGKDCLSEYTISFTNVYVDHLYAFDYLLYHLRPYGIIHYNKPLPEKVNFTEVMAKLRSEKPIPITTIPTTVRPTETTTIEISTQPSTQTTTVNNLSSTDLPSTTTSNKILSTKKKKHKKSNKNKNKGTSSKEVH